MNRKRFGQFLIGGVFSACALVIAGLIELVKQEEAKAASADGKAESNTAAREEPLSF